MNLTSQRNKLKYIKSVYCIEYTMTCDFVVLGVVSGLLITATAFVIQFFSDPIKIEDELKNKKLVFNT